MRFSLSLMTVATLLVGLAACNDGSTAVESKPMKGADTEASGTTVNAKPEKFDPAKTAAQEPAGPTTSMVFDLSLIHI